MNDRAELGCMIGVFLGLVMYAIVIMILASIFGG